MSFLFLYFLDAISQPNRDRRWKLKPESEAELGEIQSTLDAPNGRCGWNRQPKRPDAVGAGRGKCGGVACSARIDTARHPRPQLSQISVPSSPFNPSL